MIVSIYEAVQWKCACENILYWGKSSAVGYKVSRIYFEYSILCSHNCGLRNDGQNKKTRHSLHERKKAFFLVLGILLDIKSFVTSVRGVMVIIHAFQACDPSSILGGRTLFQLLAATYFIKLRLLNDYHSWSLARCSRIIADLVNTDFFT